MFDLLWNKKKLITEQQLEKAPIVLTSYGTLLVKDCILLRRVWSRVIFDEAHHLRNDKTRRFQACINLRTSVRWLVTGTPIQNKMADFKSLCRMANISIQNNVDISHFILRRRKCDVGINLPPLRIYPRIVKWKNIPEMKLSEEIHSLLPNQCGVSSEKRKHLAATWGKVVY